MAPSAPRRDPDAPFPHPLGGPPRRSAVDSVTGTPPAPAAVPAAPPVDAPDREPADVRAARFGYVITPWGDRIEADRIEEPHRAPFKPRFDVRWRPETGVI